MAPKPDTGQPPDYVEAIFTCKGDYDDPNLPQQLELLNQKLQALLKSGQDNVVIKKVEPWNSVKVTVNIPKEAAERLKLLANQNDGAALRNLGIISLQMEGDRVISLTFSKSAKVESTCTQSSSHLHPSKHSDLPSTSTSTINNLLNSSTTNGSNNLTDNFEKDAAGSVPKLVPPLIIPRPKSLKRQRNTPSGKSAGSKSRSTKAKSSPDILDSSTVPVTASLSLPVTVTTSASSIGVPVSSTSVHDLGSLHPALKDTKYSTLPKSSTIADISDQETVHSLLATLFKIDESSFRSSKSSVSASQSRNASNTKTVQSSSLKVATDAGIYGSSGPGVSLNDASSIVKLPDTQKHVKSEQGSLVTTATPLATLTSAETVKLLDNVDTTNLPCTTHPNKALDLSPRGIISSNFEVRNSEKSMCSQSKIQSSDQIASGSGVEGRSQEESTLKNVSLWAESAMQEKPETKTSSVTPTVIKCKVEDVSDGFDTDQNSSAKLNSKSTESSHSQQTVSTADNSININTSEHKPTSVKDTHKSAKPSGDSPELTNGFNLENGESKVSTAQNEPLLLHGKPVSVICSSSKNDTAECLEDNLEGKLSPAVTKSNLEVQEPVFDDVKSASLQSSGDCSDLQHPSTSIAMSESNTLHALPRYDGPTQHHMIAMDSELPENGSSTSTDSGVVTSSPKSDICPTPPGADEEQHKTCESSVTDAIGHPEDQHVTTTVVSNSVVVTPTFTCISGRSSATESLILPPISTRPSVSLLKNPRPSLPSKVVKENIFSKEKSNVTTVIEALDFAPTTYPNKKLNQQMLQKLPNAHPLSYIMTSQGNISSVLLAAANAVSNNQPYNSLPSYGDYTSTHLQANTSTSKLNMSNNSVTSSSQVVEISLSHSITSKNSNITVASQHHTVQTSAQHNTVTTSIESNSLTNVGNSKPTKTISEKHLSTEILSSSSSKVSGVSEKAVIVTSNSVASTAGKALVNTAVSASTASKAPSVVFLNVPTSLPGVSIINHPSSSTSKTSSTSDNVDRFVNSHSTHEQPSDIGLIEDGQAIRSQSRSQSHLSPVNNVELRDHSYLSASDVNSSRNIANSVPVTLQNGISDVTGDHHDCESLTTASNHSNLSPASVVSSCTSLEVHTSTTEVAASLSSPSQRKSGRVRTIKSPDPDYVTQPTKASCCNASGFLVRKRVPRPIPEDSESAPTKKAMKSIGNKVMAVEPVEEAASAPHMVISRNSQLNGPTSHAKRNTRSSGLSDLQALPTVYRERKRSKR